MRTSRIIVIILTILFSYSIQAQNNFIPYNLRVKVDGKVQIKVSDSLQVMLFKSGIEVYKEKFDPVTTNSLGVVQVKIGTGVPYGVYNFDDIDFSAMDVTVAFNFGDKQVNGGNESKLKFLSYAFTAQQARYVDTLRLQFGDTIEVLQTMKSMGKVVSNVNRINATKLSVDSMLIIPYVNDTEILNVPHIVGSMVIHASGTDTIPKFYDGKEWKSVRKNIGLVEEDKVEFDKALKFNSGNIYLRVGAVNEVQEFYISPILDGIEGKVLLNSMYPDVIDIQKNEATSKEMIRIIVKQLGSTLVTAKAQEDSSLVASMVIYIADTNDVETEDNFIFPVIESVDKTNDFVISNPAENTQYFKITNAYFKSIFDKAELVALGAESSVYNNGILTAKFNKGGLYKIVAYDKKRIDGGQIVGCIYYNVIMKNRTGTIGFVGRQGEGIEYLYKDSVYNFEVFNGAKEIKSWYKRLKPSSTFQKILVSENFVFDSKGEYDLLASYATNTIDTAAIVNFKVVEYGKNDGQITKINTIGNDQLPENVKLTIDYDTLYHRNIKWYVDKLGIVNSYSNFELDFNCLKPGEYNFVAYDPRRREIVDSIKYVVAGTVSDGEEYFIYSKIISQSERLFYSINDSDVKFSVEEEHNIGSSNPYWRFIPNATIATDKFDENITVNFLKKGKHKVQRVVGVAPNDYVIGEIEIDIVD
jgi:hypothetical protein